MAVRRVLKMGEPLLREVAAAVTRFDAELATLVTDMDDTCLLYTSPSPRDRQKSRMPSSA